MQNPRSSKSVPYKRSLTADDDETNAKDACLPVLLSSTEQAWPSEATKHVDQQQQQQQQSATLPLSSDMMIAAAPAPLSASPYFSQYHHAIPGPSTGRAQQFHHSHQDERLLQQYTQRQTYDDVQPTLSAFQSAVGEHDAATGKGESHTAVSPSGSIGRRVQSCDICRVRKVKCVRLEGPDGTLLPRCKQCDSNDAKCTYIYVPKKPGPQTSSAKALARKEDKERKAAAATAAAHGQRSGTTANSSSAAHASVFLGSSSSAAAEASMRMNMLGLSSPTQVEAPSWDHQSGAHHAAASSFYTPYVSQNASEAAWMRQQLLLPHHINEQSGLPAAHPHGDMVHAQSTYTASSVAAAPSSLSPSAHAGSTADSGSPFNNSVTTTFGMRSRPTSPFSNPTTFVGGSGLRSRPASPSPSNPRAACLHASSSSSSRSRPASPSSIPGMSLVGGSTAPSIASLSPHGHAFISPSLYGMTSVAPTHVAQHAFAVAAAHQPPLHSAPPTMTHFPTATTTPSGFEPTVWPSRNASFSHAFPAMPTLATDVTATSHAGIAVAPTRSTPFVTTALEYNETHWQQQQQQHPQPQQNDGFLSHDVHASAWPDAAWSSSSSSQRRS